MVEVILCQFWALPLKGLSASMSFLWGFSCHAGGSPGSLVERLCEGESSAQLSSQPTASTSHTSKVPGSD